MNRRADRLPRGVLIRTRWLELGGRSLDPPLVNGAAHLRGEQVHAQSEGTAADQTGRTHKLEVLRQPRTLRTETTDEPVGSVEPQYATDARGLGITHRGDIFDGGINRLSR